MHPARSTALFSLVLALACGGSPFVYYTHLNDVKGTTGQGFEAEVSFGDWDHKRVTAAGTYTVELVQGDDDVSLGCKAVFDLTHGDPRIAGELTPTCAEPDPALGAPFFLLTLDNGQEKTIRGWSGAPESLGGDGKTAGQRSGEAHDAMMADRAAAERADKEAWLDDYLQGFVRAAAAVPDGPAKGPSCETAPPRADPDAPGWIMREEDLRVLAAGIPKQEYGYGASDTLWGWINSGKIGASWSAKNNGTLDKAYDELHGDPPRLRIIRLTEGRHPQGVEFSNGGGVATFEAGLMKGHLFVVDRPTGELICVAPFTVTNAPDFTFMSDSNVHTAALGDMQLRFRETIRALTP